MRKTIAITFLAFGFLVLILVAAWDWWASLSMVSVIPTFFISILPWGSLSDYRQDIAYVNDRAL